MYRATNYIITTFYASWLYKYYMCTIMCNHSKFINQIWFCGIWFSSIVKCYYTIKSKLRGCVKRFVKSMHSFDWKLYYSVSDECFLSFGSVIPFSHPDRRSVHFISHEKNHSIDKLFVVACLFVLFYQIIVIIFNRESYHNMYFYPHTCVLDKRMDKVDLFSPLFRTRSIL